MERLEAFDLGTLYWFGARHAPGLNEAVLALTRLGDSKVLTVLTILAVVALALARLRRQALGLTAGMLLVLVIVEGLQPLVGRPRPDVAWRLIDLPQRSSFPSGHATGSMAFYLGLALLVPMRRRLRPLAVAGAVVLALAIGLSRLYLGVHYPTDVFAGWAAGLACALLAWVVGTPGPQAPRPEGTAP